MSFNIVYNIEALDNFSAICNSVGKSIAGLDKRLRGFNNKIADFGRRTSSIGKNISIKVSAPLAAFGGLSLKTAVSFEKAMNMVAADSNASAQQIEMLRQKALLYGRTTQFTATQVAQAEMFLGRAGKRTNEILAMLPNVLQLAASAQMDMGDAANTVVQIMSAYQLKTSQLADVNNVLVKSFTSSNVNLEMLGESFKMAGSVLKSSGISIRDASAAFGVLGNAGMQATMSGTGLRRVIGTLLNPPKQLKESMHKLNLTFVNSHHKLLPLVTIIKELREAGITASGAMALFGLRGGPIIETLVENYPELVKYNNQLQKTGDISERISKAQMAGLPGATRRVQAAFQNLQLHFIKSFAPTIIGIADILQKLLNRFDNLPPNIQKLIGYLVMAGAALGPVLMFGGKMIVILSVLGARIPIVGSLVGALGLSFRLLWKGILGPIGVLITLGSILLWAYKRFKIVHTIINLIGKALYLMFVEPIRIVIKTITDLVHAFDWIWKHLHGGTMNIKHTIQAGQMQTAGAITAGTGIYNHNVRSSLDINVYDPTGMIKQVSGKTTGQMNVNLGQNMAFSR